MKKGNCNIFFTIIIVFMLFFIVIGDKNNIKAEQVTHTHCICGEEGCENESHELLTFIGVDALPVMSGNYFLLNDITINETYHPVDGIKLCLNGYSIKAQDGFDISLIEVDDSVNFVLTDCKNNVGSLKYGHGRKALISKNETLNEDEKSRIGLAIINYGSFTMWKGSIVSNGYNEDEDISCKGTIYNCGNFYLNDGIIGNNELYNNSDGSSFYNKGNLYLNGGTIYNNKCLNNCISSYGYSHNIIINNLTMYNNDNDSQISIFDGSNLIINNLNIRDTSNINYVFNLSSSNNESTMALNDIDLSNIECNYLFEIENSRLNIYDGHFNNIECNEALFKIFNTVNGIYLYDDYECFNVTGINGLDRVDFLIDGDSISGTSIKIMNSIDNSYSVRLIEELLPLNENEIEIIEFDNNSNGNFGSANNGYSLIENENKLCFVQVHEYDFSIIGKRIIASCKNKEIHNDEDLELTLNVASEYIYNGNSISAYFSVDTFSDKVLKPNLYFEGIEETIYPKTVNSPVVCGKYKAYAVYEDTSSDLINVYPDLTDYSFEFEIKKATYDMSSIMFNNTKYTYDGSVKTLEVSGNIPQGVIVSYENNILTNVGCVNAVAMFSVDTDNYNSIENMYATLTIEKANYDVSNIRFENSTYQYDGLEKKILITGELPNGVTCIYSNNTLINVGSAICKVSFIGDYNNYNVIDDMEATLVIEKGFYNMSGISFGNKIYTYDGKEKELTIYGNLPIGVSVEYENNKMTNAGNIIGTAKFTGDYDNYHNIDNMTAMLTINKASYDVSNIVFNDATFTYDGKEKEILIKGKLPDGVMINYENNKLTNAGEVLAVAKFVYDENNYNHINDLTAILKINKANYDIKNISFDDATYPYDGNEKTILISGKLPTGVTCVYENNTLTNIGQVKCKAKFITDPNYNDIDDMYATLTITQNVIKHNISEDKTDVFCEIVVGNSDNYGINYDPSVELKLNSNVYNDSFKKFYKDNKLVLNYNKLSNVRYNEMVVSVYDIKIMQTVKGITSELQPNDIKEGTKVKLKILIPENDEYDFVKILHIHNKDDIEEISFDNENIIDGYYIIECDRLSEFAFVCKKKCIDHWFLTTLLVLLIAFCLVMWFVFDIRSIKNNNKINFVPIIGFSIYFILLINASIFIGCVACIVLLSVNALLLACLITLYIIFSFDAIKKQ